LSVSLITIVYYLPVAVEAMWTLVLLLY